MKKRTKIILIVLAILLVTGTAWIAYRIHVYREDSKPKYCELTDKEREFFKSESNYQEADVKRYDEEMLYLTEMEEVEWMRQLYADLENRYPGYQFRITWKTHTGMFGPLGFYVYHMEEEITKREFEAYAYYDDQWNYDYEKDNFYRYFVEEDYAAYVGELLKAKGVEEIAKTGGVMLTTMGKECDSDITVEEIVSKHIEKMSPSLWIYLEAKGMTEEECKEYSKEVQEKLEEINLRGMYGIFFCDMTAEEIKSSEKEDMVYIYIHNCESWNWGKEEEE